MRGDAKGEPAMAEEKWMVQGPQTIELEGVRRLKVGLIGGQVDIVAHDEPTTRVEVHLVEGRELKVRRTGDQLEIDHPQIGWDNWLDVFRSFRGRDRVDVSVMVPREVSVKLGVVGAGALVSGIRSDASVSTVSGDLVIDGVEGELTANSVSGEVTIRDHTGPVTVHTVSGDITAQGELSRFSCDGVNSEVYLDLAGIPDVVRVNTVSGEVTARFAPETAAKYTVNTVTGRVRLDGDQTSGERGRYTGRFGILERRFTDLLVNTVSGGVSVLHSVPA